MNQERRSRIIDMLNDKNMVTNAEIMETFGVSIETVRRDLSYLEERGLLQRVYGGAVKKQFLNVEPEYLNREKTNAEQKRAIAKEAEKLIDDGDAVFFDIGTTSLEVADALNASKRINAFTNSLRVAIALGEKCASVIVPGGELRNGEFAVSGSLTESNMQSFNVRKAIIGVGGITADGVTDYIVSEASIRAQVVKNANTVIVVADYSKFGVRAVCNVCPPEDIDVLITDARAPKEILRAFEKKGVRVIVVKA